MPALTASGSSGQAVATAPISPRSPPGVSLALKNGETKTPGRVIPGASRPRSRTSQGQEPYTGVIDLTLRGDVGAVSHQRSAALGQRVHLNLLSFSMVSIADC